jgi:urease accessory protein
VKQLLDLLQISDSSFPTGAYVHSGGLEWLAQRGPLDLEALLRLRLRENLGRLELVFLLAAYERSPIALDERLHALTLPREAREASRQVGRRLLANAVDLFGAAPLLAFADEAPHAHHPVVFGLVGAVLGVPTRTAAEIYAFQTLRGLVSAAQRLTRLGQTEAQRLLHRLKPAVVAAAEEAATLTVETTSAFAPIWDVAAMAHERAAVRLFVS